MPDISPVPALFEPNLESEPLVSPLEEITKEYALAMVKETFDSFSRARASNHESRWLSSDALYLGYMPQKFWEGTRVPRASVGVEVVFDQVETALPSILGALFPQDEWFQCDASNGGKAEEARKLKEYIRYVLSCDKEGTGLSFQSEIELAVKDLLIKGNGGVFLEWDAGKQRPIVTYADVRDIYVDPGLRCPNINVARSVIRRSFLTVDEILGWAGSGSVKLPSKEQLYGLTYNRYMETADSSKDAVGAIQGQTMPASLFDNIPLPSDKKIEVLTYYSKTRMIIVLGRQWVAYNEKNALEFIPFDFAPCYIVNGQFYARSVADVQESNQRAMEGLLNARLDHVALASNPPRVVKGSALRTPTQQRWRPGAQWGAADPQKDIAIPQLSDTTTNVWEELGFIQGMADRRTGLNGGNLRAANANRTATGINFQAQGAAVRLQSIVQHLEEYLIVPLLYKIQKMLRTFASGEYTEFFYRGQAMQLPKEALEQEITFSMKAASTMISREKLMQQFPFILQYMANGQFVSALQSQGITVNWAEMMALMQDATGLGPMYNLVRPMSPEEIQRTQQPAPAEVMRQQEAQASQQIRLQMGQMKVQGELQKEMLKKQPDPMDLEREKMKLQLEQAKGQLELQMLETKAALAQETAQMKLRMQQMEMQMKEYAQQRASQFAEEASVREAAVAARKAQVEEESMRRKAELSEQKASEGLN